MGMTILVLIFALPIIGTIVALYLSRSKSGKRRAGGGGGGGFAQMDMMAQSMGGNSPEAMYAMMFPDIAPLFQPEALLEWYAWFAQRKKNKQLIRDGRRWHGEVPGFAQAATMAVKGEGEGDTVTLQDKAGQPLVEMLVEAIPGGARLATNAGVFTLTPDAPDAKVAFKGADRSFAWRGGGNWSFNTPVAPGTMEANHQGVNMGVLAAGAATGVAAGLLTQQALAAQKKKDQEKARLKSSY